MKDYDSEIVLLKRAFNLSDDFVVREFVAGSVRMALVFCDGMVEKREIDMGVLTPLIASEGKFEPTAEGLKKVIVTAETLESFPTRKAFAEKLAKGACGVIVEGAEEYFAIGTQGYATRPIMEPPTAAVIKGPREGFTEDFKSNMVLIRRRFGSGKLVFKAVVVGRYTRTQIRVCYLKGIARKDVVDAIIARLGKIDIDGIVDSSYVAKFLEERNYSVFKQSGATEKPDILASKLLDGRVGVIVDGSPMVVTLPFMLIEDFHDSEDYYRRPVRTTVVRIMRLLGVFFAVLLPGVFVALQSHQYQVLPLELLVTIINSTTGIPFSPVLEMLIALVFFEVLGEASVRMPRYFGMAMSVVGGIILGETAVNAGVLSSLTVLITAMSSIGLFAIPDEVGAFSVIRISLVFVGATFGIYGILLAVIAILAYVCSMEIYGVAYLAPFAPVVPGDFRDSILKVSIKDRTRRTGALRLRNNTRLKYEK